MTFQTITAEYIDATRLFRDTRDAAIHAIVRRLEAQQAEARAAIGAVEAQYEDAVRPFVLAASKKAGENAGLLKALRAL